MRPLPRLTKIEPNDKILSIGDENMADYILFDFDGTVFDTSEGVTKCMQYGLSKIGIEAELSDLLCFMGPPLTDMMKLVYGLSDDEAKTVHEYYRERYSPIGWEECKPFEGMPELIKKLRAAGKKVAIATSKPIVYTERILRKYGMYDDFDLICGCELDGTRSKKWEVIDYALKQFKIAPEQAIMIGDRKYDFIGAAKCAVKCIGVRFGFAEEGELEAEGAKFIAEDCEELFDYLVKND